ncbi:MULTISPECIES: GNAT family N-acetyltransferase [unclassified Virgibacillus]|uniref:GNAT family N-acetyltransferase n=1 Tax=unclassified Virgibacillus TaxID=2620237 RepID=UPI00090B97B9|nr:MULTISPECIES: GNAT family N-acetyltransferase [unclassified Virgibacillus]API92655.1 hypothetical protein BKP57_13085 [Virgibacillus sp. 6R]MBS7428148.1 GNAT family N-acetyltransferase [Virgibacillus sp. 19R1-5]
MCKISFDHIYHAGEVVAQSDLYVHYQNQDMLLQYNSNFLHFLRMPSLEEFEQTAAYLHDFHSRHGQHHVKFTFPQNIKPTEELIKHFIENNYNYRYLELFTIKPSEFPRVEKDSNISIQFVTENEYMDYSNLKYQQDVLFGSEFAKAQRDVYKKDFQNPNKWQIVSYFRGNISGCVDVIIGKGTAEIDNLFVLEEYRKQGIGSMLQQFVMDHCPDKLVILVADGEDTPREMYIKQRYCYRGFQYEVQKVYL